MTDTELFKAAEKAMAAAYNPYSRFAVGAALLCADGSVYTGCNIENASFTPTVCAERVAFFKAVSEGRRSFVKIAVAGGSNGSASDRCPPCGVCRQVMSEFCNGDFEIILRGVQGIEKHKLSGLLPLSFKL